MKIVQSNVKCQGGFLIKIYFESIRQNNGCHRDVAAILYNLPFFDG